MNNSETNGDGDVGDGFEGFGGAIAPTFDSRSGCDARYQHLHLSITATFYLRR
jgi:hypothetical protein